MEQKQTAVEYAVEKLEKFIPSANELAIDVILEKAKEMEKEQIIDAFKRGTINEMNGVVAWIFTISTFLAIILLAYLIILINN